MALELRRRLGRVAAAGLLAGTMVGLSGCGNFFVYPGSLTSSTSSGDYVYVSNSSYGNTYVNGYSLSTGLLVATTSSPYLVGYVPSAMAVTPNNSILYIASETTGGIYPWSIGTGGAITVLTSSSAVAGLNPVSIDISPDGQWLFALDGLTSTMTEYSINYTTGALSVQQQITYAATGGAVSTPFQVKVAPTGQYVAVALGNAGDIVFPFTTSNGTLGSSYGIATGNINTVADQGLVMDSSNNLYITRTGAVAVYALGATGATAVTQTTSPVTGSGARSILATGSYVYTGNELDTSLATTDGSVSEFSQSSGKLTSLGTVVVAPYQVYSLGVDNSGKYVLAGGYNTTSGLEMYTIGSSGALAETSYMPTAASVQNALGQPTYPTVMALTHSQ